MDKKITALITALFTVLIFALGYILIVTVVDNFEYRIHTSKYADESIVNSDTGETEYFQNDNLSVYNGIEGYEGKDCFYISGFKDSAKLTADNKVIIPNEINGKPARLLSRCFAVMNFPFRHWGIALEEGNKYYVIENDTLYTLDKTKLLYYFGAEKEVKVPVGVKTICDHAFYQARIESVQLPDGLKEIEECAFDECTLTKVYLPDSVTSLGKFAFFNTPITDFHISSSIETIEDHALAATQFDELELPEGLTTLGSYVFSNSKLKLITLPSSLKNCGNEILGGCNELEELNINCSYDCFGNYDLFRFSSRQEYPHNFDGKLIIRTKHPLYPCRYPAMMLCFDEVEIYQSCSSDSFEPLRFYDSFEKRGLQKLKVSVIKDGAPVKMRFEYTEDDKRSSSVTLFFE